MAKPPIMQLPSMGAGKTAVLRKQFLQYFNQSHFAQALTIAQQMYKLAPLDPSVQEDLALAYLKVENWALASKYALMAVAKQPNNINALDIISQANGCLGELSKVQTYGKRALGLRAAQNTQALIPHTFDTQRFNKGAKNLIAFSLYGSSSKYCEPAVINTDLVESLYPGWQCRFYVDSSVPSDTLNRLLANGADIVTITPAMQKWPAPMWRFAAYDDEAVARVLFRDADSVISPREASAVAQWIADDTQFHIMRDSGSHTELILAGMWGVKAGALPVMADMIAHYLQKPVKNAHFADQFFLRRYVWPIAVASNTHHDSMFGFGERNFDVGSSTHDSHVGYAEGIPLFALNTTLAKGTKVRWQCINTQDNTVICSYYATIKDKGLLQDHIPHRYAVKLHAGVFTISYQVL